MDGKGRGSDDDGEEERREGEKRGSKGRTYGRFSRLESPSVAYILATAVIVCGYVWVGFTALDLALELVSEKWGPAA